MKNLPIDDLQEAWQLATQLHDGQKYGGHKDGQKVEYLNHIGSVAFEIINAINNSENMNAALAINCAILHDVIEDTAGTYEMIKDQFGQEVADGVLALTKNTEIEGKENQMTDSLMRIKNQPKEIWAVKMADRIMNLYAPPFYWTNEKKLNYLEEAKKIHTELKDGNKFLADRLEKKINDYVRFIN